MWRGCVLDLCLAVVSVVATWMYSHVDACYQVANDQYVGDRDMWDMCTHSWTFRLQYLSACETMSNAPDFMSYFWSAIWDRQISYGTWKTYIRLAVWFLFTRRRHLIWQLFVVTN